MYPLRRMNTPPFRMDIPFIVCLIWLNMAKNMQNLNIPQTNMPKNTKFQNIKNISSQTRPGLLSWVGFENNIFCNIYAKYVKYAKHVFSKYVQYAIYAQNATYVILVYNLGSW